MSDSKINCQIFVFDEAEQCWALREKELLGNLTMFLVQSGEFPCNGFSRAVQRIRLCLCWGFFVYFLYVRWIEWANNKYLYFCIPFTLYLYFVFCEVCASTMGAMKQHYCLGDLHSVLDPAVQDVSSHLFLAQILFSIFVVAFGYHS